jgi:hypothetical protein
MIKRKREKREGDSSSPCSHVHQEELSRKYQGWIIVCNPLPVKGRDNNKTTILHKISVLAIVNMTLLSVEFIFTRGAGMFTAAEKYSVNIVGLVPMWYLSGIHETVK